MLFPFPLSHFRVTLVTQLRPGERMKPVILMLLLATAGIPAASKTPAQVRTFDVASIKPDPGCTTRPRTVQAASPDRLHLECITVQALVEYAYGVWANAV